MESKLSKIFLDQVDAALSEDPCDESLFSLFKIISPNMKRSSLDTDHEKHFKKLRAEIYPDKHQNSCRAKRLFQCLSEFYEKSLDESKSGPARKRMKTSHFPLNFSCIEKWTYMNIFQTEHLCTETSVNAQVAFQCINARGSIVHGKKVKPDFYYFDKDRFNKGSTKQVFEVFGLGYKGLSTSDEIKEELMTKGPVVSTSFQLSKAFLTSIEDRKYFFDANLENKVHDVLITGWKHTPMGEVWKICPLVDKWIYARDQCFNVAFGQYDIDRMCVAPKSTFEEWSWEHGPYFQKIMSNERDDWYSWSTLRFSVNSKQLEELSEAVGGDLIAAATSKKKFTLQNSKKKAHSRSCYLTKVKHDKDNSKCWRVSVEFV